MIATMFVKILPARGPLSRQMSALASVLRYAEYGEPEKVVEKCEETLASPKADEILVRTLAAPINPADINTIQGEKSKVITIFSLYNC
jgi:mitochondrial enoyl-[acyl-carrier protein] reductase / trans-2-enoyl-CoA reductase